MAVQESIFIISKSQISPLFAAERSPYRQQSRSPQYWYCEQCCSSQTCCSPPMPSSRSSSKCRKIRCESGALKIVNKCKTRQVCPPPRSHTPPRPANCICELYTRQSKLLFIFVNQRHIMLIIPVNFQMYHAKNIHSESMASYDSFDCSNHVSLPPQLLTTQIFPTKMFTTCLTPLKETI